MLVNSRFNISKRRLCGYMVVGRLWSVWEEHGTYGGSHSRFVRIIKTE